MKYGRHVHTSSDAETPRKIGARRGEPVILRIDAEQMGREGLKYFVSANGVWLTDAVPVVFLRDALNDWSRASRDDASDESEYEERSPISPP